MPAETEPQTEVWMAFPSSGYALGDTSAEADEARATWANVANAIVEATPVSMVVSPDQRQYAERWLSGAVNLVEAPLDDAWMRDIGPTFVVDTAGHLGAVDWVFNGWGQQSWAQWDHDAHIGQFVAQQVGAEYLPSALVNEGGGIHVDGQGTVFLTETVQLDPLRNPGWTKADVESEVHSKLGTTNPIWLPRGLYRDSKALGTKGHVDIVAALPSTSTLLLHDQTNPAHPDYAIMGDIRRAIDASRTVDGTQWNVISVPAPKAIRDDIDFVDYSYINHLVTNDVVIACGFDDPNDAPAAEILQDAYGRSVVTIDARPLFARGGGIHCITQQVPRP